MPPSTCPSLLLTPCCCSVKDYCIERGFSWAVTVANTVCHEQARGMGACCIGVAAG